MDKLIGRLVMASTLVIVTVTLRGFVLTQLWAWFVVNPLGFRKLSIPEALGITLIASMLTLRVHTRERDLSFEESVEEGFNEIAYVVSVLFIGWVYYLFI